jgi:hypothetical protein
MRCRAGSAGPTSSSLMNMTVGGQIVVPARDVAARYLQDVTSAVELALIGANCGRIHRTSTSIEWRRGYRAPAWVWRRPLAPFESGRVSVSIERNIVKVTYALRLEVLSLIVGLAIAAAGGLAFPGDMAFFLGLGFLVHLCSAAGLTCALLRARAWIRSVVASSIQNACDNRVGGG